MLIMVNKVKHAYYVQGKISAFIRNVPDFHQCNIKCSLKMIIKSLGAADPVKKICFFIIIWQMPNFSTSLERTLLRILIIVLILCLWYHVFLVAAKKILKHMAWNALSAVLYFITKMLQTTKNFKRHFWHPKSHILGNVRNFYLQLLLIDKSYEVI